jgi:DNA-binding transcriptional ArsR family regulator
VFEHFDEDEEVEVTMGITEKDIDRVAHEFESCQKVLTALGDETRQHVLLSLLAGPCEGSRVVDVAAGTSLSRPAVSHHMQILREAGIVRSRKEGTCVYYYLDPADHEIGSLVELFSDIRRIMRFVPSREEAAL